MTLMATTKEGGREKEERAAAASSAAVYFFFVRFLVFLFPSAQPRDKKREASSRSRSPRVLWSMQGLCSVSLSSGLRGGSAQMLSAGLVGHCPRAAAAPVALPCPGLHLCRPVPGPLPSSCFSAPCPCSRLASQQPPWFAGKWPEQCPSQCQPSSSSWPPFSACSSEHQSPQIQTEGAFPFLREKTKKKPRKRKEKSRRKNGRD
jgi:hypothetical protein